jgi:glycosyltransferase involved in cell wall biosynthesis
MPAKQKVLLIVPTLAGGGAERVFLTLAQELSKFDYIVELLVLSGEGPLRADISPDISFVDLKATRARFALWRTFQHCRRTKPDIVMTTLQATTVFYFVQFLLRHRPFWIARLENPFSLTYAALPWGIRSFFKFAVARANVVIALTLGMANDLHNCIPSLKTEQVRVIANPIDIEKVKRQGEASVSEQIESPAVFMCGRLTKQKGYLDALAAFCLLLKTVPEVHLYIIGEGPDRAMIEQKIQTLGLQNQVKLLGWQTNPHAYLRRADIFLMTSRWEGFGNVIVEAMALGVPVVVTDCPQGPRDILGSGRYGKLVPVGVASLASEAMAELLLSQSLYDHLSTVGKERASQYATSWIMQEYDRLLSALRHE